jgi:SAM-dependent methyltransferase
MDYIDSLQLDLSEARILDVGCGVGYFSRFFVGKGCSVVATDARPDLVAEAKARVPEARVYLADVERDPLSAFGTFDIVLAYGVIYHLENPLAGLRNMASVCRGKLLIESIVCDSESPALVLADETLSYSQALRGIGTRPSPTYLIFALNRIGFKHIYTGKTPPVYPDYNFDWKNDLADQRDGHPLRWTAIASREEMKASHLIPLI